MASAAGGWFCHPVRLLPPSSDSNGAIGTNLTTGARPPRPLQRVQSSRRGRPSRARVAPSGARIFKIGARLVSHVFRSHPKDDRRRGWHEHRSFTFLRFTFRAARGGDQDREDTFGLQPRGQRGRLEEDGSDGAGLEAPPSHRLLGTRSQTADQPCRARVDAAMVAQQVQAAARTQESRSPVEDGREAEVEILRSLDLDDLAPAGRVTRTIRAV